MKTRVMFVDLLAFYNIKASRSSSVLCRLYLHFGCEPETIVISGGVFNT